MNDLTDQTELTNQTEQIDYLFKYITIGNQSVGKSSFIQSLVSNKFSQEQ